ncbi:MAG: CaiB/BaiF CoA-transferase family protein [Dehalococcoidia bacterium]|nr:CaiB/BaiF CoA-transferase family protein [Dehalococcoidia bacterium]
MAMALDGIKVIDLSRMAPGPFCTMVLGDLGAEVIRVEEPGGGRMARERASGGDQDRAIRNAAFNALNRNKRSIALNLKDDSAQKVLHQLVGDADVFVEGFRPGVVSRLGCDFDTLSGINPRLVYCSLSGYGQDGPYSGLVGHDINYISVGGALGVIGDRDGPPVIPYNIIADFAGGGLHAATAILAAIIARGHTGRGQYVDVAMSDGVTYMLASLMSAYFSEGVVARPGAMSLNGAAPYYNVYRCRDGRYISVGCIEPWFWAALCRALDRDDLVPMQFDESQAEYIKGELRDIFITRDRDDWWDTLSGIDDIAVAKVSSLDEVASDPQNLHREMVIEAGEVNGQSVRQVGIGPKLSDTPGSVRFMGATTGQHTDDILAELSYSAEEAAGLRESGAVA